MVKVLTPLKFETTRADLTINSTKTKYMVANEDIGVSSDVGAEIDIDRYWYLKLMKNLCILEHLR